MNAALLVHDLRLQWRHGIHAAYGVVVALYALGIALAGTALPDWAFAILIYSDPAVLGFFFLGGLMLLEKGEGVRMALATTPISARDYLAAKAATLTGLAVLAVAVLSLIKPERPQLALLIGTTILVSIAYVALGAIIALRFRTVNAYLIGSAGLLMPATLPAGLALIDPMPFWLALYPPVGQLRLILVASGHAEAGTAELFVMALVVTLAALILWLIAERALARELGPK